MVIEAVLFDLDGVLVNTEPLKGLAHVHTVQAFGGFAKEEWYAELMGKSHQIVRDTFIQKGHIAIDHAAYDKTFRSNYEKLLITKVGLTKGAKELVNEVKSAHKKLALVSSSRKWTIEAILSKVGLDSTFDVIVSADDVVHEKPDPEPYLTAVRRLSLESSRVIVIEDSESGITSAERAGILAIAIRHTLNVNHDLSKAIAELPELPNWVQLKNLVLNS